MSVATPVKTWVASLNAGGFISHGQSLTVTINITGVWEIQIPIGARYGSGVSLASPVYAYPSNDGGATYDTEPIAATSIPATVSVNKISSLRLTTGQYAVQVQASSPSVTFFVLTQEILSAFNIV
jgi:hypothetical protein